jgi:DNA-directed RNA polymerase specialized sigma24 family protein
MDTVIIESKQFQQLLTALQRTSDLLALNLVKDSEKQNEKIVMLSDFGYGPTDISRVLNISNNTVNVTLSRARKAKTENKDSKSEKQENKEEALKNVT